MSANDTREAPLEPWEEEMLSITPPPPRDIFIEPVYDEQAVTEAERRLSVRFDRNFVIIERAIAKLTEQAKRKPPRPRRTAGAARLDPDDIRAGRIILAATIVFGIAAGVASFSGQYAMGPYTFMPPYLFWLVPLFIDLPLTYLGWMRLIFRRRKQKAPEVLVLMIGLTLLSTTINVSHVLSQAGVIAGGPLTYEVALGAVIMGSAPLLIVISWEMITKLLVKPFGEKTTAAATRRRTTKARSKK